MRSRSCARACALRTVVMRVYQAAAVDGLRYTLVIMLLITARARAREQARARAPFPCCAPASRRRPAACQPAGREARRDVVNLHRARLAPAPKMSLQGCGRERRGGRGGSGQFARSHCEHRSPACPPPPTHLSKDGYLPHPRNRQKCASPPLALPAACTRSHSFAPRRFDAPRACMWRRRARARASK